MLKRATVLLLGITLLGGCKKQEAASGNSAPVNSAGPQQGDPHAVSKPSRYTDVVVASVTPQYNDPPVADVGLSVEQAYAAIPHRRTVWVESDSTVPSEEKTYLKVMFQVLDQGVAVRVVGLQNYSNQQFDSANIDAEFDHLIAFVHTMPVPKTLVSYHNDILAGLNGQRAFFDEWKSQRDNFQFSRQVQNHPGVRNASNALRTAYGELMSKYPNESQTNKDAFFDYHCALDFI